MGPTVTTFDPDATVRRPRATAAPGPPQPRRVAPRTAPTPPAGPPSPTGPGPAAAWVPPKPGLRTVIAQIGGKVIVDPIRDGFPDTRHWPRGLVSVIVVAVFGILVCSGMILGSGWIRGADDPVPVGGQQLVGSWSVMVLLWLCVLTIALGLTANLHIHIGARFLVLPLLLSPFLSVLSIALLPPSWSAAGGVAAIVAIVVFTVARIGRRFAWFEFPVLLVLSALAVFVPMGSGIHFSYDFRATMLLTLLVTFTTLATPALIVTGYSAAQVAVSLSEWTADRVTRMLERPATIALSLMLGAAVIIRGVALSRAGDPSWSPEVWVTSIAVLTAALLLSLGLLRFRRDKGLHSVPPEALDNAWTPLAYPLAFLVVPQLALSLLAIHVDMYLDIFKIGSLDRVVEATQGTIANAVMRVISVGGALWLAVVRARRNDRITPVVLACYCVLMLMSAVRTLTGGALRIIWTIDALAVALVALTFVMVALLWIREGHREVVWKQVLLVSALATLFRFREPLSEPSLVFAGVSGTVVILLSLFWRILTDGTLTHGDSRALPRASRVLFFVTAVLLSAVTLAWSAQTRITGMNDHALIGSLGDHMLGKPLMMAAGICAVIALVGRLTDDDAGLARFGSEQGR